MKKFIRKMAIVAKNESVIGTDANPGAGDALLARNVTITPLDGEQVEDDFLTIFFGASPTVQVSTFSRVQLSVPFAGVATAGALPAYSSLLRACAMALTEDEDVMYVVDPVTDAAETVSIYAYLDGMRQKFIGARGNVRIGVDAKSRPEWQFDFMGIWTPATDTPLITPVLTGWLRALPVTKVNTTLSLDGIALEASSFSWDAGNRITKEDMIGVDEVEFTGRVSTGSVTFRTQSVATNDWLTKARDREQVPLILVHGLGSTNVVKQTGNVELGNPTYGEREGVHMTTIPLRYIPTGAGNNEWQFEIH